MITINYDDVFWGYDGWETAYYPEGVLFTGTVVEFDEKTQTKILSILEWKNGFADGIERWWDHQGHLEYECQRAFNFKHGESRSWYPNGQIESWLIVEYDYWLERIYWDEKGAIVKHVVLDMENLEKTHGNYYPALINERRREYQYPLPPPLRDAPDGKLFEPFDYRELLEKYRYLRKDVK